MLILARSLFLGGLIGVLCWPANGKAAVTSYDESLKQVAEGVLAEAVKLNKHRMALLDFTDATGHTTAVGRFLAEEIGTQLVIAGELQVVERDAVEATLKRYRITQVDRTQAQAARRAAKAMRADVFLRGSYLESADGVAITLKLLNPINAEVMGAARGHLPALGPLAEILKEAHQPPVPKWESPKVSSRPVGLGFHQNEYYELVVESIEASGLQAKLAVTIENRAARDVKVRCRLQDTLLTDDHGAAWAQGIEENRDGLCVRGLELSPHQKAHLVLTFTAPPDTGSSHFTLHYHETAPRPGARFTIGGLKVQPAGSPAIY
ncbi:MAG: hypothetical protein ICV75_03995 [Nitrospiraceae bacterium]|nr:hypothetical protein [Nitrospiraceae bacterium]